MLQAVLVSMILTTSPVEQLQQQFLTHNPGMMQQLSPADKELYSEFVRCSNEGNNADASGILTILCQSPSLQDDQRLYLSIEKAVRDKALGRTGEYVATIEAIRAEFGQDARVGLGLDLELAVFNTYADKSALPSPPSPAQLHRQYEQIFSKYSPLEAGVIEARIHWADKAIQYAATEHSSLEYAKEAVAQMKLALQAIEEIKGNPATVDQETRDQLSFLETFASSKQGVVDRQYKMIAEKHERQQQAALNELVETAMESLATEDKKLPVPGTEARQKGATMDDASRPTTEAASASTSVPPPAGAPISDAQGHRGAALWMMEVAVAVFIGFAVMGVLILAHRRHGVGNEK